MKQYSPLTVFPLFVLVIVIVGIGYTVDAKSRFANQSLAQVHIASDSPAITSQTIETKKPSIPLLPPLSDLLYPDTQSISESASSIRLESVTDFQTITNWYKEKLLSLGYTSKSAINANSNGNIENRIIGSKGSEEVYIEIKKPNGFIKTAINIELNAK